MDPLIVFEPVLHCSIIKCEIFNFSFEYNGKTIFIPDVDEAKLNWFDNKINWLDFKYENEWICLSNDGSKNKIPYPILILAYEFMLDSNNYKPCLCGQDDH